MTMARQGGGGSVDRRHRLGRGLREPHSQRSRRQRHGGGAIGPLGGPGGFLRLGIM